MKTGFRPALAGAILISLGLGPAMAGETLSPRELNRLFPGDFQAVVQNYNVRFSAKTDGTLIGKVLGSSDEGRWSVQGGKLCITLESWLKGRTNCSRVIEQAGWYEGSGVKFRKL
ncbi:MAG: hypothetical protein NWR47_06580 [Aestuariivirgaceae bacterium]|nr:hypothetical protein [Aestuariivirgaceae bacterium]